MKDNLYKQWRRRGETHSLTAHHPLRDNDLKQYRYVHNNPTPATMAYRKFLARKR